MYCPKCGCRLPDSAVFCGKCGSPVSPASPTPAPKPPKKRFAAWPFVVMGVLLLSVGALVLVLMGRENRQEALGAEALPEAQVTAAPTAGTATEESAQAAATPAPTAAQAEEHTEKAAYMGNTWSNLANMGQVVEDGEWVYCFTFEEKYPALYKMRHDGSECELLLKEKARWLNLYNGVLYYLQYETGIASFDLTTHENTILFDDGIQLFQLILFEDMLYYTTSTMLGRMELDGSHNEVLIRSDTDHIKLVYIDNDALYLRNAAGIVCARSFAAGSTPENIVTTPLLTGSFGYAIFCGDAFICTTEKGVERISLSGERQTIYALREKEHIESVGADAGWVYISLWGPGGGRLLKLREDGSGYTEYPYGKDSSWINLCIVGNWIYYDNDYEGWLCRIRTDGTENQPIGLRETT